MIAASPAAGAGRAVPRAARAKACGPAAAASAAAWLRRSAAAAARPCSAHTARRRPLRPAPLHAAGAESSSSSSSSDDSAERAQQQAAPAPAAAAAAASASASTSASSSKSSGSGNLAGALAAMAGMLGGMALLAGGGYLLRGPIKLFLNFFIAAVDEWGMWGYAAYILVYAGLEMFAMPAIPLTMSAGAIFGVGAGTVVVSIAATLAATAAFLVSRYVARDRILEYAKSNKRFAAIDCAIAKNGLKFVTLLRLSPLLPLALSNYIYGLTSVDLGSYVLGSWAGMLPGTYAYVTAGHVGKAILIEGGAEGGLSVAPWQVGVGLTASLLAIAFIGQLAKKAIEEADADAGGGSGGGGGSSGWQPAAQPAA